ncbi:MAG: hypothetical protein U0172_03595 [Nitrospiraceae bacterium]
MTQATKLTGQEYHRLVLASQLERLNPGFRDRRLSALPPAIRLAGLVRSVGCSMARAVPAELRVWSNWSGPDRALFGVVVVVGLAWAGMAWLG